MIKKNICLLLGAGASAHLGFPLGEGLKNSILKELDQMRNFGAKEYPEAIRDSNEDHWDFYEKLHMGNWNSPDAFLEDHPEFMNTGKFLICKQLAEKEASSDFINNMGWYKHLVKAIHVNNLDDLKNNNLSIVTFNYDRSIDYRLHGYAQAQFGVNDHDEAWKLVEDSFNIVHLHGSLGEYPKYKYGSLDDIYERSRDIKIISEVESEAEEGEDGFVNDTFKKASELLNDADRVVVLGFGFAKDNVDRLQYFDETNLEDVAFNYPSILEIPNELIQRKNELVNQFKSYLNEDKRDIIIAIGSQHNVPRQSTNNWLKQWGLEDKIYFENTDDLFERQINPFIF